MTMEAKKSVLLAMSGGVDSGVAALILSEEGYDVTGVTFLMFGDDADADNFLGYGKGTSSEAAKAVCDACGIGHMVLDLRRQFAEAVSVPFVDAYASGLTPNPCVICNSEVKFRELLRIADEKHIDYIATGHYARVAVREECHVLAVGKDGRKDQTYMLYRLREDVTSRLLLPLGDFTKSEIRELAKSRGLECGDSPDSQDICFIPDGDFATYMEKNGFEHVPGNYIDSSGRVIGKHGGFARYTSGQRKGLGVAFGEPMYVLTKDSVKNTVTLVREPELFSREIMVKNVVTPAFAGRGGSFRVKAKIRYTPREADAVVYPEGDVWRVVFDEPQRAPTRGQHCVFYDGGILLGGGEIM